ncbi:unnamed protein product, partial [Choristocarpus tenellus]
EARRKRVKAAQEAECARKLSAYIASTHIVWRAAIERATAIKVEMEKTKLLKQAEEAARVQAALAAAAQAAVTTQNHTGQQNTFRPPTDPANLDFRKRDRDIVEDFQVILETSAHYGSRQKLSGVPSLG